MVILVCIVFIKRVTKYGIHNTFRLDSAALFPKLLYMQKPDQLRELFRTQKSLNERIGTSTKTCSALIAKRTK